MSLTVPTATSMGLLTGPGKCRARRGFRLETNPQRYLFPPARVPEAGDARNATAAETAVAVRGEEEEADPDLGRDALFRRGARSSYEPFSIGTSTKLRHSVHEPS